MKLATNFLRCGAVLFSLYLVFSCQLNPIDQTGAKNAEVANARAIGGVIPGITVHDVYHVNYDQFNGNYRIEMNSAASPPYSSAISFNEFDVDTTVPDFGLRATGTLKPSNGLNTGTAVATLKFNNKSVNISKNSSPKNFDLQFAYVAGTNSFTISGGGALTAEVNNLKFEVISLPGGTNVMPTSVSLKSGSPSIYTVAYNPVAKTLSFGGTLGGNATAQLYYTPYEGTSGTPYKITGELKQTGSYGAGIATATQSVNATTTWTPFKIYGVYQTGTNLLGLGGASATTLQIRNLNVTFY